MKAPMLGAMVLAVLPLAGCVNATVMRAGKVHPSKPAGCDVRYENLSYDEASEKYDLVGLVTLTGATSLQPTTWEGQMRERLWPKVCELGGTIVTPNASMGSLTGMIQFAVWVERPPSSVKPVTVDT